MFTKVIIYSFILVIAVFGLFVFQNEVNEAKYYLLSNLPSYKKDRDLVAKYFDTEFYLQHYGEAVKKSNLQPVDHFLQKDWYSTSFTDHKDPNSWFNTTLYKEWLWGDGQVTWKSFFSIFRIQNNPFVDFLRQANNANHQEYIDVWSKEDELGRAWLAIEGLLRLNKFNVRLHLASAVSNSEIVRFEPQVARGLVIDFNNIEQKSFYDSDFIRNPNKYNIPYQEYVNYSPYSVYYNNANNFIYLMHYLDLTPKYGRINPMMINFAHYCIEPPKHHLRSDKLIISKNIFDRHQRADKERFKKYLIRISDGFDLMMVDAKLPINNLRLIPGFMKSWVNENELSSNKEFSVSFLMTRKNVNFEERNNYSLRKQVWDSEKYFTVPTKFYLSYRDKKKFPKNIQDRVMPTNSKKWVFNSQFNIAMENCSQEYYFTEKLLGCFISLTVPIYIGCPNILDYFDQRGMLIVSSVDEIVKVANSLTPETYQKMLPYLKENKRRALEFLNLEDKIIEEFRQKLL